MTAAWHTLSVGGGGFITGIDISTDGSTRVARTDTWGAYISTNGGPTWRQLITPTSLPSAWMAANLIQGVYSEGDGVWEILVAPNDPTRIYMVWFGTLFVSSDSGATFTAPGFTIDHNTSSPSAAGANRLMGRKMAVDPVNKDCIYIGTTTAGVYVSTNGGTSFTQVSSIPTASTSAGYTMRFDTTQGTTGGSPNFTNGLYVHPQGSQVYKTSNAGSSWSATTGGPSTINAMDISPTSGTVFVVDNSGQLWRYTGTWANTGIGSLWTVCVAPTGAPAKVVAIEGGGSINISLDDGVTWSGRATANSRTATDIPWLATTTEDFMSTAAAMFDPIVANKMWLAEGIGVWYTTIGTVSVGTTTPWTSFTLGIEQLVGNWVCSSPAYSIPMLACWDRQMFLPAGNLTSYTATQKPQYSATAITDCWQIDYASSDPTVMVAIMTNGSPEYSGISSNGGATWTEFPTVPVVNPLVTNGSTSTSSNVLHFASVPDLIQPGMIATCGVKLDFNNSTVLSKTATSVTIAANALQTINSGDTIIFFGQPGGSIAAASPTNFIWTAANDAPDAWYTKDGGTTWARVAITITGAVPGWSHSFAQQMHNVCADRKQANTFYAYNHAAAANGGGLYRSVDSGDTWTRITNSPIANWSGSQQCACLKSVPYFVGGADTTGHLFMTGASPQFNNSPLSRTTNASSGTATWTDVPNTSYVQAFGFGAAKPGGGGYPAVYFIGFLSGVFGTWRSDDNCSTWTQIGINGGYPGSLDMPQDIEGDAQIWGRAYVAFGGSGWAFFGDTNQPSTSGFSIIHGHAKGHTKMIGY